MKNKKTDIVTQNKIFIYLAFGTGLILLIPFLAMQFNWNLFDFIVAGSLIFGIGSAYVLVARKTHKHRLAMGFIFAVLFFWLWAELAVGIFTNWGN